jgi:hypothetical protein
VLLGKWYGTRFEPIENIVGTWWEHIANNKFSKDNVSILYWVHGAIPQWLSRIPIHNCLHHLIVGA